MDAKARAERHFAAVEGELRDLSRWMYDHPKLMTFKQVQEAGRDYLDSHPESFEKEVTSGKGSDIAVLSYTSGTTGLPKGCILSHTYLFDTVLRIAGAVTLKPFTQYLSYDSCTFFIRSIIV